MRLITFGCLISLLWATIVATQAQERPRRDVEMKIGAVAPSFTLQDPEGKNAVKLADLKGKPVVLIFGSCT